MSSDQSGSLARLRPEKLDDQMIQEQIALIKKVCEDVDLESIALIFHECDYNIQTTISRLQSGDVKESEWQTARSTHKKKHSIDSHPRSTNRPHPTGRSTLHVQSSSIHPSSTVPSDSVNEDENRLSIPSADVNEEKKSSTSSLRSPRSKPRRVSTVPSKPVTIYRTFQLNSFPNDIQFGDIRWEENEPIVVSRTNSIHEQEYFPSNTDFIAPSQTSANEIEGSMQNLTLNDQTDSTDLPENVAQAAAAGSTSSLATTTTTDPSAENNSSPISYLPNAEPLLSPIVPFSPSSNTYSSISTDYPSNPSVWSTQTNHYKTSSKGSSGVNPNNYSPQTYHSYPAGATQQQAAQYYVGNYAYPTGAPSMVPYLLPYDNWSNNGYNPAMENYSYATTGYLPTYPNQAAYYPANKYETTTGDREYYGNYNQTSSTNTESSTSTGKEGGMKSRLSATAAAFQTPYPLATSASSSYIPCYTLPTTHFPPMDHRDNRHNASYPGNNNYRANYQQRNYPNNGQWQLQQ